MNLSTISTSGIVAITIISLAVLAAIIIIGKTFKKMTFKVGNNSLDIGGSSCPAPKGTMDDNLVHRKCKLAKTHVKGIAIGLERMAEVKVGRVLDEPVSYLIFELLRTRLEIRILDNVVENHIGDSLEELNAYVNVRSREYATDVLAFYDEFYLFFPDDCKQICDSSSREKLENFFSEQLSSLFKDIKQIERMR